MADQRGHFVPPGPKEKLPCFGGEKKLVIPCLYVFIGFILKKKYMSVPLNLQKHPTQSLPNPCSLGNHFSIQPMSGANSFQVTASNPHPTAPDDWLVLIPSGARDSLLLHSVFHGPIVEMPRSSAAKLCQLTLKVCGCTPFELCPRSRIWLC